MSVGDGIAMSIIAAYGWATMTTQQLEAILPPIQYQGEPAMEVVLHHHWTPLAGRHTAVTLPIQGEALLARITQQLFGRCHIWINQYLYEANPLAYAAVLKHEYGHCNGWPPNHPRGFESK